MKLEVIKPDMMVRNKKTGKIGVLFNTGPYPIREIRASLLSDVGIIYQDDDRTPNPPRFELTSFEDLEEYQLRPEDLLTADHRKKVCKQNTSEQCRYLIKLCRGYVCARVLGNSQIAKDIDLDVLRGEIETKGNNCGGRYNKRVITLDYVILK